VTRHTISYIRKCIRSLDYVVTLHAAEELDDDNLTILDLESIILTGEIAERQRDRRTRDSKSIVRGATLAGEEAEAVVKVGPSGKLVVLTVHLL
jgi:hypothetical protein